MAGHEGTGVLVLSGDVAKRSVETDMIPLISIRMMPMPSGGSWYPVFGLLMRFNI